VTVLTAKRIPARIARSPDEIILEGPAAVAKRRPVRANLSARHQATLRRIFEGLTSSDIPWRDIERLFEALGGTVTSGSGSRRRVRVGDRKAVFHEPHPERVTDRRAVADVSGFLASAGVTP
jgi:hypothetical protein